MQLGGLAECNALPGAFCGNDYHATARLAGALVNQVQEQTERIGGWIGSLGFRGIFGLDFVSDPELQSTYAIDLNPRWLGSTALFTQAEAIAGRTPLAVLDLATRLGALSGGEGLNLGERCREPVEGCQLILYSGSKDWSEVTDSPPAGVYRCENGNVRFVRDGIRLGDCIEDGEILVTAGMPRSALRIQPRAHILRIYSRGPALASEAPGLLPWCRQAMQQMHASVATEAISTPS